jgi:hypothetical protein
MRQCIIKLFHLGTVKCTLQFGECSVYTITYLFRQQKQRPRIFEDKEQRRKCRTQPESYRLWSKAHNKVNTAVLRNMMRTNSVLSKSSNKLHGVTFASTVFGKVTLVKTSNPIYTCLHKSLNFEILLLFRS